MTARWRHGGSGQSLQGGADNEKEADQGRRRIAGQTKEGNTGDVADCDRPSRLDCDTLEIEAA